ncbi:hypothetical protein H5P34_23670 [Mycobacterium porcinum]|jgi:hypothetical protein|uniref:Uncharacterized protein n=2 Tax=Mycolicibacterium TaxID=1866885 RepID=A0A7I9WAS9_MYCAG|nr:hypothetical protein [Mycolicibacterium porcinum]GFG54813.1 hypothetical protein MAGR_62540 [Mycolicibacterium agri]CDO29749.1 hypothetical protein BN979_02547 [Mycolicibacterium vulneris]
MAEGIASLTSVEVGMSLRVRGQSATTRIDPVSVADRSVVVTPAADGVTRPPHQHHEQANDQQDDADDQDNMGERECGGKAGKEEPQNDPVCGALGFSLSRGVRAGTVEF